ADPPAAPQRRPFGYPARIGHPAALAAPAVHAAPAGLAGPVGLVARGSCDREAVAGAASDRAYRASSVVLRSILVAAPAQASPGAGFRACSGAATTAHEPARAHHRARARAPGQACVADLGC